MRISKRNTMRILGGVAFSLLALCAPRAGAVSLTVNGYTLGEQVNVIGSGRSGYVNTAELNVSLNGQNAFSYCVDLGQDIGVGSSSNWTLHEADDNASVIRAAWLVEHFRPAVDSPNKTTAIAALQVAVWEVMAEVPGDYNLYDGGFRIATGGASTGVMNLARTFLGELENASLSSFESNATWATNPLRQDQIVVNPIPEPSSLILFAAGAGLVAFGAKRKRA